MGIEMKLVIELTNGRQDAVGDCEMVIDMLVGYKKEELEKDYRHQMPIYYFED